MNDKRYGINRQSTLIHGMRSLVGGKYAIRIMFMLALLSLLISCAAAPEKPQFDLVWPLPPDEPKVKFVDFFYSSLDLGKKTGIADTLFGQERIEAFVKPYGVAVDKEGSIYITDVGKIVVFDLKKKDYSVLGTEPGIGQLRIPIGIAIASDGRIFVGDTAADRVFVYQNGKYASAIGLSGELESPSGVALDEQRKLIYVSDSKKHSVLVYSLDGYRLIRTIGERGTTEGTFNYPTNIALDREGNSYVVDTGNNRVQIFDASGKFVRAFGKIGDTGGSFARPKGIAIDSAGHIYVVDAAFQNIQIFDQQGQLLLFVGSAGQPPGKFRLPAGIAIDRDDKIYVVDQVPGSIQIFQYLGEKYKKMRPQ